MSFDNGGPGGTAVPIQIDDYYPYGLQLPGQSYVYGTDKNAYLFNGKEKQEETGYYDYEARLFDPIRLVTPTPDPHADSHPNESPYSFLGNNPINYIDQTGKDWDIAINHELQKITITANFTAINGDEMAIKTAAANWNAQSGKFSYIIGEGKNTVSYSINFNITINEPSKGVAENSIYVLPDNNKIFAERTEIDEQGNEKIVIPLGASDGKTFAMKESKKSDSQKIAHEMGHNLGMGHSTGLMGKEGGKKLSANSLAEALGFSGIGKGSKNKQTNATLKAKTEIGMQPVNFEKGNVKKNVNNNKDEEF